MLPTVTSVDDLRKLRISLPNGSTVLLSDIATIAIRPTPGSTFSFAANTSHAATSAVTFSIFKKTSADVTTADQDAHKAVSSLTKQSPGHFSITSILDSGDVITRQFNELVRDLAITFLLVFVVIFVFLGTRQPIIAHRSIPLT